MLRVGDVVTTYPYNLENNPHVVGVVVGFKHYKGKLDSCILRIINVKSYRCWHKSLDGSQDYIIFRRLNKIKKIGEMSIEQLLTHEDRVLRELGNNLLSKEKPC